MSDDEPNQRIRLQRLGENPVELSLPAKTTIKENGKGFVEGRFSNKEIFWINTVTGIAAWNAEFVAVAEPFSPLLDVAPRVNSVVPATDPQPTAAQQPSTPRPTTPPRPPSA